MSITRRAPLTGMFEPTRVAGLRVRAHQLLPKSMMGLVASSKALTVAPLLIAVVMLSVATERLLVKTETLVANGQQVEALGAQLRDQLQNLERVARQYLVLDEPELLKVFDERLKTVRDTASQFASESLPIEVREPSRELIAELRDLRRTWKSVDGAHAVQLEMVDRIAALSQQAGQLVVEGRVAIHEQGQGLRDQTELARKFMIAILVIVIPLTFLMALALTMIITRPLKQVRAGIAALGTANYGDPIRIQYPRELAHLGQRLDWLRHRLRGFEADKDRFLRDVSHELKTPLSSLREGSDLLLERSLGQLNTQQYEVAQILAESSQDLEAQIANLLAYAEWRSGQRNFSTAWFDCNSLISEVVSSQRLLLNRRGLRTIVEVDNERLFGHRPSLRVALSNLINNAIKHSPPESSIDIMAGIRHGRCNLIVRDRGPGIAPEDRARVLQPFVRGSSPQQSGLHGTGIGLSIVNETIKAHEGTLEVEDAEPGARFKLSWPCPTHSR